MQVVKQVLGKGEVAAGLTGEKKIFLFFFSFVGI